MIRLILFVALFAAANASTTPALDALLAMSDEDLAREIRASPLAAIAPTFSAQTDMVQSNSSALPLVFAHGMGDSCFNSGMKSITTAAGSHQGTYSVCIPTGNNDIMDTINGFLMNMDKSVDVFAAKIKADPKLANGFNAVGFSQGNSLIRGYIQKYNDPPVNAHVSVHGTVYGVAGFPQCNPAGLLGIVCKAVAEVCGDLAYNSLVQGILFQADYFRDPTKVTSSSYLKYSQLAQWNNEANSTNSGLFKANFAKTNKFVMVKALKDTMVFPNEGEWWGTFTDGQFKTITPMKETRMYKDDLFGLRTADEAGKIHFETTSGNHLDFTEEQLFGWLDKYL